MTATKGGAMRRRPLAPTLVATLGVLALLLAACDPGDPVEVDDDVAEEDPFEEEPDPEEPEEPAVGGDLIAAISGEPDQLDPHLTTAYPSFQVLENVYDTLVQPDPELQFEPALATDWTVSDDQLNWTFQLREGVTWHNGREFVADDVVFSYERIMEEGANAWRFEAVEEVRAVDDLTVEIEVSQPSPNLLANIGAFKGMAIVPPEIVEDGTIGQEPVGTGPFRFVSYTEGSNVVLEANPDYWGDGPHVEGVEFRFIPEGSVAMTNLRAGEVDWTDNIPPVEVGEVLDDGDLQAEAVPSNDYWYFALNNNREPFDDVNVRRALALAFDRDQLVEAAMFDAATPNQTAIPEDSFWYTDHAPYDHDPDQASELLEQAGVNDLTVDLMVTDEFEETITAAEVLEAQWGEIGVSVDIRVLDFSTWLDEQGEGNFDAFLLGWLGNIDPDDFYFAQHHSEGGFNFHGYANDQVDELLEAARTETDDDDRKDLYDGAVEIIVDEASYVYLYNPDVVQAWVPGLEGYDVRPDRAINFETVRLP
jgi:peptide/nickel transport system substrate-binding protein